MIDCVEAARRGCSIQSRARPALALRTPFRGAFLCPIHHPRTTRTRGGMPSSSSYKLGRVPAWRHDGIGASESVTVPTSAVIDCCLQETLSEKKRSGSRAAGSGRAAIFGPTVLPMLPM